jgi:outer membrane protein OmpA-like peptidoglycan-associated protein/predicted small secreted protein
MKRFIVLPYAALVLAVLAVTACVTNPGVGPGVTVVIPELFSPDPDIVDDKLGVDITVRHSVKIKEWNIQINRSFGQAGQPAQAGADDRPARQAQDGEARAPRERAEGEAPRRRAAFFEQEGKGLPPTKWLWNGKSSRPSGEMVQSASDYRFVLTVTDDFDNATTYEGIISVDVLVKREGDDYRIVVPSIIFPPNAANFNLLNDDDRRSNERILRLISRALNRFPDYKITVEGHSNPTVPAGPARDTQQTRDLVPLSRDRAQAVVNYLAENGGIAQTRMAAVGMGGSKMVAEWDDSDENWQNRRVEFLLHK